MNTKYYIYAAIFLVWTALCIFAGWHLKPEPKIISQDTTKTSIPFIAKPDSIVNKPADTTVKMKADTSRQQNQWVASKDTVINGIVLHIEYRSPDPIPMGEFVANIPVITKTIMVEMPVPFYKTVTFGYIVGSVATLVVVYLVSLIK